MKNDFRYNSVQLQHPFSTVCGQWCLFFVYHMSCDIPLKDVVSKFKPITDFLQKDYFVNRFVYNIFGLNLDVLDRDFIFEQITRLREKIQQQQQDAAQE